MSAIIEFIAVAVIRNMLVPSGTRPIRDSISGVSELPHAATGNMPRTLEPIKRIPGIGNLRSKITSVTSDPSRDLAVMKQEVLEVISNTPLHAADTAQLRFRVEALRNAAAIGEVKAAGLSLADAAIEGHQHLITSGLHTAVRNAAVKIGFGKLDTLNSPLGGEIIRLAATDASGRSIITEIDGRPERDLKIEAEVVGVTDNTCHQILEDFYAALKEEGIEMSSPPRRKPTGGICELAATKEFLAKKLRPRRSRAATPVAMEASDDDRRVQMNRTVAPYAKAKLIR